VLDATLCIIFVSFILASLTITSTMTAMPTVPTVPAVTEHVHRDKGDEDEHPKRVCRKPCHDLSPSGLWSRLLVNA
jgi:hypothetical protein